MVDAQARARACALACALTATICACEERPRTYATGSAAAEPIFEDSFDREALGDNWRVTGEGIGIEKGAVVVSGARNHPAWLRVPLPDNFLIEFDAWASSEAGDIKVEVAGDGESFAKTVSYTASGYVLIFGGWDNKISAIARQDEHGQDRQTRTSPKVEMHRRYRFSVTRRGDELRWEIDGREFLKFVDDAPLRGAQNRYFGLSGWDATTRFDNLKLIDLTPSATSQP